MRLLGSMISWPGDCRAACEEIEYDGAHGSSRSKVAEKNANFHLRCSASSAGSPCVPASSVALESHSALCKTVQHAGWYWCKTREASSTGTIELSNPDQLSAHP
jgi:hypothetical protein